MVGSPALLFTNPNEHDHLRVGVKAKEQPLLLEELRPAPVAILVAQGSTMLEILAGGVRGDIVENQPGYRR